MGSVDVVTTMHQMSQMRVINGLGYSGLLPFAAGTAASFLNLSFLGIDGFRWFSSYSAIILVFLSGSLWGLMLGKATSRLSVLILAFSNGVALLAWATLGLAETSLAGSLLLLLAGYGAVLILQISYRDLLYSGVKTRYWKMRLSLTTVVIILHVFMLVISLVNK